MEKTDLYEINKVKNYIENAKSYMRGALNVLSSDITVNGVAFQKQNINNTLYKMNDAIDILNQIIRSLNN